MTISVADNAAAAALPPATPAAVDPAAAPVTKKPKPCCSCPETKKARDACIVEKGEANCGDLIEAHKVCMRKLGFEV